MEEAETLGDRISIMSSGQLVCSGTAMFLKKRFSTGYRLRIAKQESFDYQKVNEIIRKHVIQTNKQKEIEAKKDLSIEFKPELFEKRIFGFGLTKNRFIALLKKRFLIAKRHWKMMLLQVVIPCVVLICSLLLFGCSRRQLSNETIQYDIGLHSPTEGFFQDLTGQNFTDLGLVCQRVARRRQVTAHFINQDALEWTLQRAESVGIQSYNTKLLTGLVVQNEDQSDHTTRLVLQSWFKTTTLRMLVGDLNVTSENAFIDNISLKKNLKEFQKKIGYCPQFDALNDYLTVHETIELFAILRGISGKDIKSAVNQLIEMVDLQDHVFKRTTNLSGGNKRKLSLAVAIIGCPPVVFLDEPTSGVDPAARRKIWSTLVFIQDKLKCSVILTSHSMDECEALCSRIAIMVNGQFQCLGSSQHLKVKFGQGFEIRIKLKNDQSQDAEYLKSLEEMVLSEFASAVLKEHHQTLVQFHVSDAKTLWADLFRKMEQLKTSAGFEDYTVSDTNLEQVFLMFARKQKNTP